MSEFQKIEKIHRYSTRVIANAGTVDTYGDFVFNSTGKNVPLGTPYHIHYLENPQQEIFMSGAKHSIASRLITPTTGITLFKKYEDAKGLKQVITQPYGKKLPGPKDYTIGRVTRTFARKVVNGPNPLFEIKQKTNSPYYEYVDIEWRISGPMDEVREENEKTLEETSETLPSIVKVIGNPLEYYVEQKTRTQRVSEAFGVGEIEEDVNGNIVFTSEMLSSVSSVPLGTVGTFKMRGPKKGGGIGKMKIKKGKFKKLAQQAQQTGGGGSSSGGGSSGGGGGGGGY